jgi:putative phosphoribosyl transferase
MSGGADPQRFLDRASAGRLLGDAVAPLVGETPCRLYGLARGGVLVAKPMAERLGAPLDVMIARKIGAPHQPEFAVGALAEGGGASWDDTALAALHLDRPWQARAAHEAQIELDRRVARYRGRALSVEPEWTAILVDDGIATGATVLAALRGLAALGAVHRAVTAPVASREALDHLRREADWVLALIVPEEFRAVGLHYVNFDPVADQEVLAVLNRPI